MKLILVALLVTLALPCFAADLPAFENDMAADAWLRQKIPDFKASSEKLEKRGGYEYTRGTNSSFLGFNYNEAGKLSIEVPKDLKGLAHVTHLLQHRANAGHASRYKLVDADAISGKIANPNEFIKLYLYIYWEAMGDFGLYLADLEKTIGPLPKNSVNFCGASPAIIAETTPEEFIKQQPKIEEFLRAKYAKLKSAN